MSIGGGASAVRARRVTVACWVLVALFVLLAGREALAAQAPWAFVSFVVWWLVAPLGIGLGAVALVNRDSARRGSVLLPAAIGWPVASIVATATAYLGAELVAFPLLVLLGVAGWIVHVRSRGASVAALVRAAVSSRDVAAESALVAGTFFAYVGLHAWPWMSTSGGLVYPQQYWDIMYHLAFIKRGLYAGLPLQGYPLIAQFSRLANHPVFDTFMTVIIKGLRAPIDGTYYAILLPATYASFLVGIMAVLRAWAGRMRTVLVGVAVVAVSLAAIALPLGLRHMVGDLGLAQFRWFMFSQPGALGGGAAMAALALMCDVEADALKRVVLAGLLVGASIAMKAQIAIVVGPAFVSALVLGAWKRRLPWRTAAIGTGVAAVSCGLAYITTLGAGAPPTLQFGAMATYITTSNQVLSSSALVRGLGRMAAGSFAGSVAFLLFYVLIAFPGWRLIAGLVAAPFAATRGLDLPRRMLPLAFAASMVVWVVVVALLVVQRSSWMFLPWNISWHSIQMMWPLGVLFAAITIEAALPADRELLTRFGRSATVAAPVLVLVLGLSLGLASAATMRLARHVGGPGVPADYVRLVERLPRITPVNAVVAQDVQIEQHDWVSAIGGRLAYAERLASPELVRGQASRLRRVLTELYALADPAETRALLLREGIDYVIVAPGRLGAGLAGCTHHVAQSGGFELRAR